MEDLWREVFSVGTEWEAMEAVYQNNWDFSNLEEAFQEGGELDGHTVYLFGSTESRGISDPSLVPIVIAVVSRFPPSDKIGVASVQREENILPMKQMKMDWVPYVPLKYRASKIESVKSSIFILRCKQRKVGLKHLNFDRLTMYNYCMPYFKNPFQEDELDHDNTTEVEFMFPRDLLPPLHCSFDWEMDDLDEFTTRMIENGALGADQRDEFEAFVKDQVREAKKKQREAGEAKAKELEEMDEEIRDAIQSIKLYKFYPVMPPAATQLLKSTTINRYYGKAHKVL